MRLLEKELEPILSIYRPEFRYLFQVDINYPGTRGMFKVGPTNYTLSPLEHLTLVEAQLCLNQLTYASFGYWAKEKKSFSSYFSFDDFMTARGENILITNFKINCRRPIQKSKVFSVIMDLAVIVHRDERTYFASVDYQFGSGEFTGSARFALISPRKTPPPLPKS